MFYQLHPDTLRPCIIDRESYEKACNGLEDQCRNTTGDFLNACSQLGELYAMDHRYTEARVKLETVLKELSFSANDKLKLWTNLRLGLVYLYQGELEEALIIFEQLEYNSSMELEYVVCFYRGLYEFEIGNYWLSLYYLERAHRKDGIEEVFTQKIHTALHRVRYELKIK